MLPKQHIIFGLIFAGFLYLIFPKIGLLGFLIIFLSSFLIDVDHYLYYVYKKKDLSLKYAHSWFIKKKKKFLDLTRKKRNKVYCGVYFLHGIEVLIVLFLLTSFSKYFFFVFMGFAFHLLLDSVDQTIYWDRVDKFSLVYDFFKFKKLKFFE